ncbi:MAG: HD domain-containing protein [Nitrosotalea sp.]
MESIKNNEIIDLIENEANLSVDNFIEGAIELAKEVHSGVKREDGTSSFLETHIWPVVMDVIRHYRSASKPISSIQIVSAILHDVLEDNERILDLYSSKSYGFDAYFEHRFGHYVNKVATTLKTKPIEMYQGSDNKEREFERFHDYCNVLAKSDYDVKVIKLADRLNNMKFIVKVPGNEKIMRYVREAEDFYIAYTILDPPMSDFYLQIRESYEQLKKIKKMPDLVTQ